MSCSQSHFGALVFSRFLDRDGDGFITLDDISTVQALMMQKSHHFVKVGAVVSLHLVLGCCCVVLLVSSIFLGVLLQFPGYATPGKGYGMIAVAVLLLCLRDLMNLL
jgi:hypothetical protein